MYLEFQRQLVASFWNSLTFSLIGSVNLRKLGIFNERNLTFFFSPLMTTVPYKSVPNDAQKFLGILKRKKKLCR